MFKESCKIVVLVLSFCIVVFSMGGALTLTVCARVASDSIAELGKLPFSQEIVHKMWEQSMLVTSYWIAISGFTIATALGLIGIKISVE